MGVALDNVTRLEKAILEVIETDIGALQRYEDMKADIVTVSVISGPLLMKDFIDAFTMATKIAAKVRGWLENAETQMKHEEAKAVLERAPGYFAKNKENFEKLRDSKSLRDSYLYLDEIYLAARQRVAALRAMVRILDNKADSFRMAHDDAKKVYATLAEGPGVNQGYRGMASGGNIGDNDGS